MFKKIILLCVIFSQTLILGVFGAGSESYLVYQASSKLCGSFTPGNTQISNWLQEGWTAVKTENNSLISLAGTENIKTLCVSRGLRYAGIPIGVSSVSESRKAAEFLASKKIIASHFLDPSEYKLSQTLSRKELMKVIMQISKKSVSNNCKGLFQDVANDWGCKYIESGLTYDFVAQNEKFRPEDSVSWIEAIKLVFKARNIDKVYETNFWVQDYLSSAYYLGFTDTKITNYNDVITRGDIFQIVARSYPEFKNW